MLTIKFGFVSKRIKEIDVLMFQRSIMSIMNKRFYGDEYIEFDSTNVICDSWTIIVDGIIPQPVVFDFVNECTKLVRITDGVLLDNINFAR